MILRRHLTPNGSGHLCRTSMLRSDGHAEALFRPPTTVVVDGVFTTRGIRDTPDSVRQTNIL
eukprot:5690525-Alexandrium_andersonii.AAC.1